ncbi:MAG: ribosome maturation factor RimM [Chloroflexota bacterium]
MAEALVPLGEIVATHGLNGWLKINPFNLDTTALASGAEVILEKAGEHSAHRVQASQPHRNQLLVKLEDLDSIDAAASHIGATLCVRESALQALESGQYYHYQVIGFEVYELRGACVGTITATMSTPGGELYVIQGPEKEHLIPAVKEIIEKVDFSARRVIVDLPEGLLDL